MTWLRRFRLKQTIRSSLWLLPAVTILSVLFVAPLIRWLDRVIDWRWRNFTPEGARSVLGALTASMLTLVVFVVSSLLIVVQLASAQLTPRIISRVFAEQRLKCVLSGFTFTYPYAIATSGRIEDQTPQLPVTFAIFCNLACLGFFFWFVQWLGGSLRPIAVLRSVVEKGRYVVESVYPLPFDSAQEIAVLQ